MVPTIHKVSAEFTPIILPLARTFISVGMAPAGLGTLWFKLAMAAAHAHAVNHVARAQQ